MNWTRTVLDGFAMAAYFNLFAGLVALYKLRLMFPGYPPAIIKAAKDPPTSAENRFYWIWICFMARSVPWRVGQQGSGLWL